MSYVKGQSLVSLIIGTSAGVGLWVFGALGWLPGGQKYALLFGAWVAITELIPYLGPWLGAIPPFLYALVVHPPSAIWVFLLFLGIHQIEGHIVVPNVMGNALRLHPLLVIFGLLAGGEIYGLPGALMALPLLAAGVRCGSSSANASSWRRGTRWRCCRSTPGSGRRGAAAPRQRTRGGGSPDGHRGESLATPRV